LGGQVGKGFSSSQEKGAESKTWTLLCFIATSAPQIMNSSRGPNGSKSSSKSSLVIPPMSKRIETKAGLVSAAPTHSVGNFEIEKGWQKDNAFSIGQVRVNQLERAQASPLIDEPRIVEEHVTHAIDQVPILVH